MCRNAKENLKKALDEICCCENHLNTAYIYAEDELKSALSDITHAQELLKTALTSVEITDNKQLLQNTLSSVNKALDFTRSSSYGFKD